MTSIINWKQGTPPKCGKYLISDKHFNVDTDWWSSSGWHRHYDGDVMAWCKLDEIDGFNYIDYGKD